MESLRDREVVWLAYNHVSGAGGGGAAVSTSFHSPPGRLGVNRSDPF